MTSLLTPMLALIIWTLFMWLWMYATRIPAMHKAGIDATKIRRKGELDILPVEVSRIADNYNHLHEQPTVFYALVVYGHLVGAETVWLTGLAWAYVVFRIAHSLVQALWNFVPARFAVFVLSTLTLIGMAGIVTGVTLAG